MWSPWTTIFAGKKNSFTNVPFSLPQSHSRQCSYSKQKQQRRFPDSKWICCAATASCCAAKEFATQQRELPDSKRICGAAAAIAGQQTNLQCSSGVCWTANEFAVQQRRLLDSKRICSAAAAFAGQQSNLLCSSVPVPARWVLANFEATTTYMLCTTTLRLWSSPVSRASKFLSYSLLRIGIGMIARHGPCTIWRRSLGRKSRVDPTERRMYDKAKTDQSITGFQEIIGR